MPVHRAGKIAGLFLPLLLSVAGCAGTPQPPPEPLQKQSPTEARLLMVRPYTMVAMGRIAAVGVNGKPSCYLANGKGFGQDVAPGAVTITASTPYSNNIYVTGTSSLTLTVAAGQTYYIVFRPSDENYGLIGALSQATTPGETGPFNIYQGGPFDEGKITPVACVPAPAAG